MFTVQKLQKSTIQLHSLHQNNTAEEWHLDNETRNPNADI